MPMRRCRSWAPTCRRGLCHRDRHGLGRRIPRIADERLRLVEKIIQGRDFTCMRETVNAVEAWLG